LASVSSFDPYGDLPAVELGIDPLHREIGALHQPHLDLPSGAAMSLGGPFGEPLQSRGGSREDMPAARSRPGGRELLLVQQAHEGSQGQIEVLILLHVEVDELRGGAGGRHPVEPPQTLGR
jgi:hypothetical protein